ncbi:MAG: type II toxin-antitoxin system Phd/YefM family antitoxin [Candidatus Electrothrix sp. YB6]
MKTMAISQFKAHVLQIISQIAQDHEPLIITKRGKPVARLVPYKEAPSSPEPGRLSDTLVFEEDIISPLGEDMWEACS